MEYPTAEDYIKAVQHPAIVFKEPELRKASFEVHPLLGIPVPASGSSAVVFKAEVEGRSQALRFFTRDDAATRARYTALNTYFAEHGLVDHVAACRWIDDAIVVSGRAWPLVRMQWVDGHVLDRHVEDLVDRCDHIALGDLANDWRDLVRRMQASRFAHGDLQHGNVLIDRAGKLRLVDFDCSWISAFAGGAPPSETGHRNYQRPGSSWGPWMDTFPALVVYLSLLVLAKSVDPQRPWQELYNGDNLLFRQQDFAPAGQTPVWTHLAETGDPRIDQIAQRLKSCCTPGWSPTGDLEQLLVATPEPWWERTREATPTSALPPRPVVSAPAGAHLAPTSQATPGLRTAESTGEWWQRQPESASLPASPQTTVSSGRRAWITIRSILVALMIGFFATGAITQAYLPNPAPRAIPLAVLLCSTLLSYLLLHRLARRPRAIGSRGRK